jgi:hypothetical protein
MKDMPGENDPMFDLYLSDDEQPATWFAELRQRWNVPNPAMP